MKILSLGGAGAVCQHATRDLAEYSDFDEIVIGDYDVAAAKKLATEIGDPRLSVLEVDADDYGALVEVFGSFEVVLNGLPWKYDMAVTKACVEAGVSGLDVSTKEEQWDYDVAAKEKGIVFIPGVGATPGTTNVMARRGSAGRCAGDPDQLRRLSLSRPVSGLAHHLPVGVPPRDGEPPVLRRWQVSLGWPL